MEARNPTERIQAPLPVAALRFLMLAPPIALSAFIWWLSSQPTVPLPPTLNDKLAHALAYGLLGALWVRGLWFTTTWTPVRVALAAAALTVGYGGVDELHQSFVPGRDASGLDLLADAGGGVLGVLLALGFYEGTQRLARRLEGTSFGRFARPPKP